MVRRVAVVGSGIAGLSAAYRLAAHAQVTLFEAGAHFGGHTHTVDVRLAGPKRAAGSSGKADQGTISHGIDTGFLVFNERTYPRLIALFAELGVVTAASDMSFSVQVEDAPGGRLEWSGSNLDTVFAQRRNLLRPAFLRMLADVLRFNRLATALATATDGAEADARIADAGDSDALLEPIGDFLARQRFSTEFRDWYFLPMLGCIWSCPTEQMLRFPVATMIRFCHNHGLIQVTNRPRWFTVVGGARHYVEKMLPRITDRRLNTPVRSVRRLREADEGIDAQTEVAGVLVATDAGTERFDDVVLACHTDQSLALLADATSAERAVLGAIGWQRNRAVLHTDASVLPKRQRAWAAWNYESGSGSPAGARSKAAAVATGESAAVCLHYLINRLQPLPFDTPVLVTLNPLRPLRAGCVQGEFDYEHPVFDAAAIAAQQRLPALQGVARTWFCGAWTRYGFHEDGLLSGLAVVDGLTAQWALRDALPSRLAARGRGMMAAARATPALPLIGTGQVRHTRLRPAANRFAYPTYFLMLPMRSLRTAPCPALARNRFGLIAFHDRDHGDGGADSLAWLDALLAREGVADAAGEVWLHCYPRVLGFAFKPVSFWYCHRADGALAAIVVEVNNTFGERHCYLLAGAGVAFGRELRAGKAFHVSPFCSVSGDYRFRFMCTGLSAATPQPAGAPGQGVSTCVGTDSAGVAEGDLAAPRTVACIDHHDADGLLIRTSVSGTLAPLTPASRRAAFFGMPLMTLGVVARIHWQALKLFAKQVPWVRKPPRPAAFLTR